MLCGIDLLAHRTMSDTRLRKATHDDLAALTELEHSAFPGDRISRRSWRDMLGSRSRRTR
jgi:hypothetical protein